MKYFKIFIWSSFLFLVSCPIYAQKSLIFSAVQGSMIDNFVFSQILKEGYQRIGIKTQIEFLPAERALVYSNNGQTDGEIARIMGISKKYPNLIVVPVVVMPTGVVAFTLKNNEISVKGWESLRGYNVSIQRGMKLIEINAEKSGWETNKLIHTEQLFRLLLLGRVEVAVTGKFKGLSGLSNLKKSGMDISNIVMLDPPLYSVKLYHYLHNKNKHLIPRITASLQEMEKYEIIQKRLDSFMAQFTK